MEKDFYNFFKILKFKHQKYCMMNQYQEQDSTMQSGSGGSRPQMVHSSAEEPNGSVHSEKASPQKGGQIKSDAEALLIMKQIGIENIQVEDFTLEIIQ